MEINEVINSTEHSNDTKAFFLRRSIVENHWIQKCLKGNLMQKMQWQLVVDMSQFRALVLTTLKYGQEYLLSLEMNNNEESGK